MTDAAPILQAASGMSWLGVVFALAFFGYAVFYVGKCAYAFRMMWKSAVAHRQRHHRIVDHGEGARWRRHRL
jgi:hypothetical protein